MGPLRGRARPAVRRALRREGPRLRPRVRGPPWIPQRFVGAAPEGIARAATLLVGRATRRAGCSDRVLRASPRRCGRARGRDERRAGVHGDALIGARTVPTNWVHVAIGAELPTCQHDVARLTRRWSAGPACSRCRRRLPAAVFSVAGPRLETSTPSRVALLASSSGRRRRRRRPQAADARQRASTCSPPRGRSCSRRRPCGRSSSSWAVVRSPSPAAFDALVGVAPRCG